ncbi:MAG TPA: glycoside hydrolase family 3 C-terminal domain-containing protein [Candidatus Acidoferrales bacterium]|nr:glycoside hydrolase family 3 C-terminal domain-containing protein [Candidatus Acidoferrales bacterium]
MVRTHAVSGTISFRIAVAVAFFLAAQSCFAQVGPPPAPKGPWMNQNLSPDQRADVLIKEMTLDEKILLLHGHGTHIFGPPENCEADGTDAIPRLGIPAIRVADSSYGVTHGAATGRYSTALPSNLAAASSWDPETAFRYGALIGRELRDQGYNMSLGGGVNLTREPRDGRNFEYQGEDPLLAGTLAGNFVRGIQSEQIIGDLKHYAVNDQESGRSALNANIGKRAMRETDLRAFEIALSISDAGGVMCAYNRVNGDFACENSYLLTDVLRKDFRFKGFVIADWGATHSTAKASHAGLDQEQPHAVFFGNGLKKAVESGEVSENELNQHVHRVLRSMFASGLFDHPMVKQVPDVESGYRIAQEIAEKSIVLLKNAHDVLPLSASARSVALIGGHADVGVLSGGGSAQVDPPGGTPVPPPPPTDFFTAVIRPAWMPSSPLRALTAKLPSMKISYNSGDDLAAASAAKSANVAVVFAYQWESEAIDRRTLDLSPDQTKLIETVAAANPKTIVVLESGSAATMPWIDKVAGVIEAWYPGIRGAEALANILDGSVNPTGKLAVTFPKSDADLPHPNLVLPPPASLPDFAHLVADDSNVMSVLFQAMPAFQVDYNEELKVGYRWYDAEHKSVLFPFGFGLSYTTYAYSGLTVTPGQTTTVTFTVKNTGKRAGTEIAQIYVSLPSAAGEPPKRLIGWTRVELAPGESKQVSVLVVRERLTVYDETSDSWKLVPGTYEIRVGGSSQDLPLQQKITF